jgi:hypothetical protein
MPVNIENFFVNVQSVPTPDLFSSSTVSVNQTTVYLSADQTFNTTALADIVGFTANLSPNSNYTWQLNLSATSDATSGYALGCGGSVVPTVFRFCQQAFSGTAIVGANNTTVLTNSIGAAGSVSNIFAYGMLRTDATANPTFKIRAATFTGANIFTIQTGSAFILTGPF